MAEVAQNQRECIKKGWWQNVAIPVIGCTDIKNVVVLEH
jgi:hypothetical protein